MNRVFKLITTATMAVLVLAALGTLLPRPFWHQDDPDRLTRHRILVLTNPIHTDLAIPIDAAALARFGFLRDAGMPIDAPGARYLVFGWGGRDFYTQTPTWSDLKLAPLLKGISLDDSVVHVEVAGDLDKPHPAVAGYDVSERGYAALLDFIEQSFRTGPDGAVWLKGSGYGAYDTFYEANGYFTAMLGCNTWTAGALRAAGLQTGWWNPLPVTLAYSLRLHN